MSKLVAYLRVSTDTQAEKGLGLHVQRDTISRWATNEGHRIVKWYEDAGQSGSNGLEHRAGLAQAIAAVSGRPREAVGIVVYRLDRLARDLIVQETLLAEVRRHKARIYSTAASEDQFLEDDPGDPSRTMIRQILGAVAEYERAIIRLRLTAGIERKKADGGYWGGQPRYGWLAHDGKLVPDPAEQDTIRLMVTARADGMSLRKIAVMLNRLEIPTKQKKEGGRWHVNTVARILADYDRRTAEG